MNEDIDLTARDDEELDDLQMKIKLEKHRRVVISSSEEAMDGIAREYLQAMGRLPSRPGEPPVEWVAPTGAHDSYPQEAEVIHENKRWLSTIHGNDREPGQPGWVEKKP